MAPLRMVQTGESTRSAPSSNCLSTGNANTGDAKTRHREVDHGLVLLTHPHRATALRPTFGSMAMSGGSPTYR